MLEINSLRKTFGDVVALDGVDLTVKPGERLAVIGLSGAGKSTLLRSINRLEPPTSGEILFEEKSVLKLKGQALNAWRARCAMIFQQFHLVPRLDVITNVLVGRLHHTPAFRSMFKSFTAEERARAVIELHDVGIADTALKRASDLSGGQQQRVAIARAMLQSPDILLADEPVASLDPVNALAVMETLRRINEERGITVIVNLHAIDLARSFATRIVGLQAGQVVFDGPPSTLDEACLDLIYRRPRRKVPVVETALEAVAS